MDSNDAISIIESLRMGIPPNGHVREFTVGRESEIQALTRRLQHGKAGALLLKANYGSGKTHLLKFIRETALQQGFAVSSVTLDAKSAVRFNRMDQILGAIWRGIEIPDASGLKGCRPFFDTVCREAERSKGRETDNEFWATYTDHWSWEHSDILDSPALFVGVRAWNTGIPNIQDVIEDWIYQPWNYYSQRKYLYENLVGDLRKHFRDPRPEWKFYDFQEAMFNFQVQDYAQSWDCLSDMHHLAQESGMRGLVLLFDEFEDVLDNLTRINHQEAAFWNLFQFFGGRKFPGMSFFAVTPNFVAKCKELLLRKDRWDFDYSRFDRLPTFEMSPLDVTHLEELAGRILSTHALAYQWDPLAVVTEKRILEVVREAASVQIEDRSRHAICDLVKTLDNLLEDAE